MTAQITLDELQSCQTEAALVTVPEAVIDCVVAIKAKAEEQGYRASDRRWQQSIAVLRGAAYLEGDDEVTEEHLDVLADALWRDPKDRSALAAIVGSLGNPLNVRATEIHDAATEAVRQLGTVDPKDPSAKAEWLKRASLAESRLTDMEAELGTMAKQNSKRSVRRVKDAARTVQALKADVTRRVAALYGL
jgi:hypothetical protein